MYNCVDIKGNRLDEPEVQITKAGMRIRGMYDKGLSSHAEQAGRALRFGGVETERIEKVLAPETFYIPGFNQPVDLAAFKRYLTANMMNNPVITDKQLAAQYIHYFEPRIIIRSLQVPERLLELTQVPTYQDFKLMISKVFKFINAKEEQMGKNVKLSSENPEDIKFYLTQYLPNRIASNFARIHNLGLVHNCPHPQNISLAGSIYDLDGVTGTRLGSAPVAMEDINKELNRLTDGWLENPSMVQAMFSNDHIGLNMILGNVNEAKKIFLKQFWTTYLKTSDVAKKASGTTTAELIDSLRKTGLKLPDDEILIEWASKKMKQPRGFVRRNASL